jgi:hypothetical protein
MNEEGSIGLAHVFAVDEALDLTAEIRTNSQALGLVDVVFMMIWSGVCVSWVHFTLAMIASLLHILCGGTHQALQEQTNATVYHSRLQQQHRIKGKQQ